MVANIPGFEKVKTMVVDANLVITQPIRKDTNSPKAK